MLSVGPRLHSSIATECHYVLKHTPPILSHDIIRNFSIVCKGRVLDPGYSHSACDCILTQTSLVKIHSEDATNTPQASFQRKSHRIVPNHQKVQKNQSLSRVQSR